ncbi:MAG: di-heme enzyme [Candidatus Thiodiazotropha sp.]
MVLRALATLSLLGLLAGCGDSGTTIVDPGLQYSSEWSWKLPPNFPVPVVPDENPMSESKFQLGRTLFYDIRLSGNGTYACASCHLQSLAFTDGLVLSEGATGQNTARNAPSIANTVYHPTLTWIGPGSHSLEQQMQTPLFAENPVEMGVNDSNRGTVLQRFRDDPDYVTWFAEVFYDESDPINFTNIIKAISTFQRGVLTGNSKFERYQRGEVVLSASEERGRLLFNGETAECFHCHGSFNFNDQVTYLGVRTVDILFHNTGLYNVGDTTQGLYPEGNQGLYESTGRPQDMGAFRAPSLYNVELTAPYMHDGSVATLEEALDNYAAGGRHIVSGPNAGDGRNNPYKSDLITLINLSEQDKADIVAFLKTLTDYDLISNPRYADPFQ